MKKITIIVIALAVISGIAGFIYYQKNFYSKDVLKLEILGPDSADLAQEIEYVVKYKNNGDTRLDEPQLIFEYPKNSLPIDESSQSVVKNASDLGGSIYPGQEKTFHFKARLFGKEGDIQEATARLTYQPKDLKARYESDTVFTTVIKTVPLALDVDSPSQAAPGKDFHLRLNYLSSVDYSLSNLKIKIDYPSDFEFTDASPQSLEQNSWDVGSLNKDEGGRVEITGKLNGNVGEKKIFDAKIGSMQDGEFVLYQEAVKEVVLAEPDVLISQQINNNSVYTASPGEQLHYEISFTNVGQTTLNDLVLINQLQGDAFDFQSIKSDLGDFQPGSNAIIFDSKKVPILKSLAAGQREKVDFWINLKDEWGTSSESGKNPVISNKVSLSKTNEQFVTKVNTKFAISQKGYFQNKIFSNSGPLPPQAGQTTSYTVVWQAKNYYSDLGNVTAKAVLPRQVSLSGKIAPAEEMGRLTFNPASREVVWSAGSLDAGRGITSDPLEVDFQINFTPESSQRGGIAELIGPVRITGEDSWTRKAVEATSSDLTTALPDDPSITSNMTIVR